MPSASLSRFALSRNKQSDKDTMIVSKLVSWPFRYQSGFKLQPAVDDFSDLVESRWEHSITQILGAITSGGIQLPANTDFLALMFSSMMATINSTLIGVGQTFTAAVTDICTATAHGFKTGQKVTVSNSGGGLPAGLAASTVYYVRVLTVDTFSLYTTYAAAKSGGTAVDITTTGTGTQTVTPEIYQHTITPTANSVPNFHTAVFFDGTCSRRMVGVVPNSISIAADAIKNPRMSCQVGMTVMRQERNDIVASGVTFTAAVTDICTAVAHGLQTGDVVTVANSGGALPTGLSAATNYWVRVIDANTFYLHPTWIDADEATNTIDITGTGSGTNSFTAVTTAIPTQEEVNPIMFTQTGASLSLTVDDGAAVSYLLKWAGFDYSLADAIDAEQRAGSNALRIIEKQGRIQSLNLLIDYTDQTWKDLILKYQAQTTPPKIRVDMGLKGQLIGNGTYHQLQMTFYNTNLTDHNYNSTPGIGKQHLPLKINDSIPDGKSAQIVITNDIPLYLA